jgi:hypothetical protein
MPQLANGFSPQGHGGTGGISPDFGTIGEDSIEHGTANPTLLHSAACMIGECGWCRGHFELLNMGGSTIIRDPGDAPPSIRWIIPWMEPVRFYGWSSKAYP